MLLDDRNEVATRSKNTSARPVTTPTPLQSPLQSPNHPTGANMSFGFPPRAVSIASVGIC
ncbi:hypothetical protein M405DRAFT_831615 [Rhizopogon salebrosus TDB-379]|nr:hypothetical protein M405DRAFT_831615 [Rhizopogon salebrosus TDB-379]